MQTMKCLIKTIECDYICNFSYETIFYENYLENRMNIIGEYLYVANICGLINHENNYYVRNTDYKINNNLLFLPSGNLFTKDFVITKNANIKNNKRRSLKYILEVTKFDFEVLEPPKEDDFFLG